MKKTCPRFHTATHDHLMATSVLRDNFELKQTFCLDVPLSLVSKKLSTIEVTLLLLLLNQSLVVEQHFCNQLGSVHSMTA